MTSSPLVSVVIPVRNGERFLAEAVASVRAQDHGARELIVVDDASTDGTVRLAGELAVDRLTVLAENQGPSAARNIGMAQATGEVVALLDADDTMLPGRLTSQLRHLASHPHRVVLGRQVISLETAEPPAWLTPGAAPDRLPALPSAAMIRMETLLVGGGFDPDLRLSEDVEWVLRLKQRGVDSVVPEEIAVRRRIHGANASYDGDGLNLGLVRAIRAVLPGREQPLVSVVIAAADGAQNLPEVLHSVLAPGPAGPLQVIVVDDGSTNGAAALAASYGPPVEVARQPRLGPGVAMNHGLLLARGAYVALVDPNGSMLAGSTLGSLLGVLQDNAELDMVITGAGGAAMIRRSSLGLLGPLDPAGESATAGLWRRRAAERGASWAEVA